MLVRLTGRADQTLGYPGFFFLFRQHARREASCLVALTPCVRERCATQPQRPAQVAPFFQHARVWLPNLGGAATFSDKSNENKRVVHPLSSPWSAFSGSWRFPRCPRHGTLSAHAFSLRVWSDRWPALDRFARNGFNPPSPILPASFAMHPNMSHIRPRELLPSIASKAP